MKATVGQWGRFEASVKNEAHYADPYADVTLKVRYTSPDGSAVEFPGFYDGGVTWKLRFMPDRLGTWHYEARFSDGAAGVSGSFECVPSDIPGMLSKDEANPMWFGFKGGGHVLVRSLHVGDCFFARNCPEEKRAAFLEWAQEQGYNMLSIASHYLNRRSAGRGEGWDTPRLWPPDAAEYRRLERILDELAERRMTVFPFAGFFGRDAEGPETPAERTQFIQYTLARLGPYWNILLNVAGPEPQIDDYLSTDEVNGLGTDIAKLDVFGHPVAVHNRTGDDEYKDSTWSTYGILQGPKTIDRAELSRGLLANHHPAKPLYAHETLWTGNKFHPDYMDDDIRKNAYVVNMSAVALNFGDMAGDSSSGFSGTLDLAQRSQSRHDIVKRVWDFFETVPFYRMRPRRDLVQGGCCLAEPGREYLVYLESPGVVNVSLEGGRFDIEWIDARNTSRRRPGGVTADGAGLAPPAGGDDWLLRLTSHREEK